MTQPFEEEVYQLHSQLCASLADPKRILILYALAEKSMNVSELNQTLDISQPTTSRHLKMLRERGLVNAHRDGQSVIYELADTRVIQALDIMRAVLADLLLSQADLARSVSRSVRNK
jgi:ArsR family transcriptional regulator